ALAKVGVPAANIRTLENGGATRDKVMAAMKSLVDDAKSGDLVIIAYSGHGMRVGAYKRWDGLDRSGLHSQSVMSNFNPTNPKDGHEVIVDREMRAWYARLDAKNVDVLVVMDSCYGGRMRAVAPFSGGMKIRAITATSDDKIHDSFKPLDMTEKE